MHLSRRAGYWRVRRTSDDTAAPSWHSQHAFKQPRYSPRHPLPHASSTAAGEGVVSMSIPGGMLRVPLGY
jgi:hypothetical protein